MYNSREIHAHKKENKKCSWGSDRGLKIVNVSTNRNEFYRKKQSKEGRRKMSPKESIYIITYQHTHSHIHTHNKAEKERKEERKSTSSKSAQWKEKSFWVCCLISRIWKGCPLQKIRNSLKFFVTAQLSSSFPIILLHFTSSLSTHRLLDPPPN